MEESKDNKKENEENKQINKETNVYQYDCWCAVFFRR